MFERYAILYKCPSPQAQQGVPVLLAAGNLLADHQTGKVLAQLKFQNIGEKAISAVYAELLCFDAMKTPVEKAVSAKYIDLQVEPGAFFGDRQPIILPNDTIRSFSLKITDIMFTDGSIQHVTIDVEFEKLPDPKETYTFAQQEQLRIETGMDSFVLPSYSHKHLIRCCCGQWNIKGKGTCVHCKYALEKLNTLPVADMLDEHYSTRIMLEEEEKERIRKEAEEKAAAERAEQLRLAEEAEIARKKHARKTFAKILVSICIIAALVYAAKVYFIPEYHYRSAMKLLENKQYDAATDAFNAMDGYKDSATQAQAAQYAEGEALNAAGNYTEAYSIFSTLTGYKDVDNIIETDDNIAAAAAAARAAYDVGNTVTYGSYGGEEIEWLVLEADGDKRIMISVKGLDAVQFNKSISDGNKWESSYVREWLNGTFYNSAFNEDEKGQLTNGVTGDKVYLLSVEEAEQYFANDDARICYPTQTAKNNGAYTSSSGACWWWLRSPGLGSYDAAGVDHDGSVNTRGYGVNNSYGCVRPVVVAVAPWL